MKARVWIGALLAVVVHAVSACGQLAVDGDYLGEPLFEIAGTVTLDAGAMPTGARGELRVALFWARPANASSAGDTLDSVTAVEQDVGAASSFPARYTLTVHEPPPASLVGTAADVKGAFGLAMLLVYLDVDADGRWDRGSEDLVGAATDTAVLYAPDGLEGGRFGVLAPGFHAVRSAIGAPACGGNMQATAADNVPIVVDMSFPAYALGDLDCDGVVVEWSGTCPSPATILALCRDDRAESTMCETCEDLLWEAGSSDSRCDEWLASCEGFTSTHECEEAWEHCREEGPDDDDCVEHGTECEPEPG